MKRLALVTGGSGNLGAAISYKLAADGYCVAVHYCNEEEKAKMISDKINADGGDSFVVRADFHEPNEIDVMFDALASASRGINVLVNNAAIDGGRHSLAECPEETLKSVFEVNFFAASRCTKLAVNHMQTFGGGAIVNVVSQTAFFGGNHLAHYAASKAALIGQSVGAARELMALNIRLNNISPGPISASPVCSQQKSAMLSELPSGRMADPIEVAEAVSWLVSEKSSYVSGITLPVTGAR